MKSSEKMAGPSLPLEVAESEKPANAMQVVTTPVGDMMSVIARAAADPNVSVDKMERLYALLERQEKARAEREFGEAMSQAQAEMPMVIKKSQNPSTNSSYAKLEAVKIAMAPTISKHGFSLMFSEGKSETEGKMRILCDVIHKGGHSVQRHMDLSPDDTGAKGAPTKTKIHGEGSTFSYGCRYLTTMLFNVIVVGVDNDGTGGHKPKPTGPGEPDAKSLATRLWNLLKPVVSQTEGWDKSKWDGHNEWLRSKKIIASDACVEKQTASAIKEAIDKTQIILSEING